MSLKYAIAGVFGGLLSGVIMGHRRYEAIRSGGMSDRKGWIKPQKPVTLGFMQSPEYWVACLRRRLFTYLTFASSVTVCCCMMTVTSTEIPNQIIEIFHFSFSRSIFL